MSDLPLTIKDAARALRAGEISSVELTQAMLKRADKLDPILGCFITRMDEQALTRRCPRRCGLRLRHRPRSAAGHPNRPQGHPGDG